MSYDSEIRTIDRLAKYYSDALAGENKHNSWEGKKVFIDELYQQESKIRKEMVAFDHPNWDEGLIFQITATNKNTDERTAIEILVEDKELVHLFHFINTRLQGRIKSDAEYKEELIQEGKE